MTTTETLEAPEVQTRPQRRRLTFLHVLSIAIVLVLLLSWLVDLLPSGSAPRSFAEAVARADRIEVGKVLQFEQFDVAILEAIVLQPDDAEAQTSSHPDEPDRFLHIVVTARVRGDRHLVAYTNPLSCCAEEPRKGDPALEVRAVEAWIGYSFVPPQGTLTIRDQIELKVAALIGRDGGGRGPGSHDRSECAEPLNPNRVCELLKIEGRLIGTATIDLRSLGLPRQFISTTRLDGPTS